MSVKLLLYCTKGLPNIVKTIRGTVYLSCVQGLNQRLEHHLNGKIVAECECEKVEKIVATKWSVGCGCNYYQFKTKDLLRKSCLNWIDLTDYLQDQNGYGLHLSNVKVFDESKELSEYDIKLTPQKLVNPISKDSVVIPNITYSCTKAPQNMCNVYDNQGNHYILISIQPQHLCKILNGEKTIEVRKKILNSLKELL